jgi:hypothetical protein
MDDGGLVRHSALLEVAVTLAGRYTTFARFEAAHRPDLRGAAITETGDGEHEHLVVTARAAMAQFSAGVMAGREMLGVTWSMGARASLSLLPSALAPRTPEFAALKLDDDGNLWVRRYGPPWDPSPDWDVHTADGAPLANVKLPQRFEPMHIGHDFTLGVRKDALDVEHVELYRLTRR